MIKLFGMTIHPIPNKEDYIVSTTTTTTTTATSVNTKVKFPTFVLNSINILPFFLLDSGISSESYHVNQSRPIS